MLIRRENVIITRAREISSYETLVSRLFVSFIYLNEFAFFFHLHYTYTYYLHKVTPGAYEHTNIRAIQVSMNKIRVENIKRYKRAVFCIVLCILGHVRNFAYSFQISKDSSNRTKSIVRNSIE